MKVEGEKIVVMIKSFSVGEKKLYKMIANS